MLPQMLYVVSLPRTQIPHFLSLIDMSFVVDTQILSFSNVVADVVCSFFVKNSYFIDLI